MPVLCINCVHYRPAESRDLPSGSFSLYLQDQYFAKCAGPQLISLIDGKQNSLEIHDARYRGDCGREGKFYEAATPISNPPVA